MDTEFNMSKPEISIIDASTGEQVVKEMTTAEHNEYKEYVKQSADRLAKAEIDADAKETAKAAILNRIGLTADELKTILG